MTPEYLASIGLLDQTTMSEQAVINAQMRMALAKVAFLPFGLMIDRWRWGVFDGSITPADYNRAWWDLKARYRAWRWLTRGEEFFDPGAGTTCRATRRTRATSSHVLKSSSTPCDAAGYQGPLHECSFYGNKAAGEKFWAMLSKGNSQPWQQTLKELTGGEQMDASAVLEYFAPLQEWLKQQNEGKTCGWTAPAPAAAAAPRG